MCFGQHRSVKCDNPTPIPLDSPVRRLHHITRPLPPMQIFALSFPHPRLYLESCRSKAKSCIGNSIRRATGLSSYCTSKPVQQRRVRGQNINDGENTIGCKDKVMLTFDFNSIYVTRKLYKFIIAKYICS